MLVTEAVQPVCDQWAVGIPVGILLFGLEAIVKMSIIAFMPTRIVRNMPFKVIGNYSSLFSGIDETHQW